MPHYKNGHFYSAQGKKIPPHAVIQDARNPNNIDSPSFQAWFFMDSEATTADFIKASEKLWAVCSAAITIATPNQSEWIMIENIDKKKSCEFLFFEKK